MNRRRFLSTAVALAGTSLILSTTTLPATAAPASSTHVNSVAQLRAAIAAAVTGGTIVVANGSYDVPADSPIVIGHGYGTAASPVTIIAQNRGGAVFNGAASFTFSGASHVQISGFVFRQASTLEIDASNRHIRLTRNQFNMQDIEGLHSVMIRADDTKVDRNHFHGKSTLGVFLCVEGGSSTDMAQRVHISRNYFSDHSFAGSNGGEPIRLGVSPRALSSSGAVVEFNLFESCNGDPEAISVKSSDNTIRYNTIRNSLGGIVLRHGNRNRVDGNYILNGSAGMRIYGNDHLIVNNYISGISASAVVIGKGSARDHLPGESAAARRGNDAPDNVQISLNTLVYNNDGIVGETVRPEEPRGLIISDNVIIGSTGTLANVPDSSGFAWSGNMLWGTATPGNIPPSGYTLTNPGLVPGTDGIARPGTGSPVVNNASRQYPSVSKDINGSNRTATADVGAHEVTSPFSRPPLSTADVGPNAATDLVLRRQPGRPHA